MSDTIDIPQIRITGPYEHRTGEFRCRLIMNGRREWAPTADSPQRAKRLAQSLAQRYASVQPLTIGAAIERYRQHLIDKGNKPASYENTPLRLRRFFAPVLESPLSNLTERRCQALYDELRTQKSDRTARPLAVDTHRAYLADGRSFGVWTMKVKLLRANPLAGIEGVGRRSHGKPQLRHNEARRLTELCFNLAAEDDGALAVLVAVLMGLRAGEIVSRTVRDLDRGGTILWVDGLDGWTPKTAASRRPIEIPAQLQLLLMTRTQDKLPAALLFTGACTGQNGPSIPAQLDRRFRSNWTADSGPIGPPIPVHWTELIHRLSPSTGFAPYSLWLLMLSRGARWRASEPICVNAVRFFVTSSTSS